MTHYNPFTASLQLKKAPKALFFQSVELVIVKKEKTFQEIQKFRLSIRLTYIKIGKDKKRVRSDIFEQSQIQADHAEGQRRGSCR